MFLPKNKLFFVGIAVLLFIFSITVVNATSQETKRAQVEKSCNSPWLTRKVNQATNCNSDFTYNGKTAAEWQQRVRDEDEWKAEVCPPFFDGTMSVDEAYDSWWDFEHSWPENEGITCVCDDPECNSFYYYFCKVAGGGANCSKQVCIDQGFGCGTTGNGSTITVPSRSFSPEGTSSFETIRTAGKEFFFELPVFGEINSFTDILGAVGKFMFNLAIPIAVILIIFSGIKMLTSAGNPTRIASAKKTLFYTLVGFAIVLIARGFFTLVKSILEIGS